jgi:hypothetical protein
MRLRCAFDVKHYVDTEANESYNLSSNIFHYKVFRKLIMSIRNKFLAALIAASCATSAMAGIAYSTGQDANGDGKDDQFTVNGADAFLVTSNANGWPALPASAITTGKYISWHPVQSGRNSNNLRDQVYSYAFEFNWSGAAMTTDFDFRWVSDDYLTDITLNGVSLGVNNLGASQVWTISNTASVTGNVNAGLNTINFLVNNTGGGATGLAADFAIEGDAALVPEPASILLFGLGLALIPALRKRSATK